MAKKRFIAAFSPDAGEVAAEVSPSSSAGSLSVTPTMRLYLPRVEARLRGITALWYCRKKGYLHTIPCNEQEWDNESWLTIATSHNT